MNAAAGYFAHVDGLRALAVVAVMAYHLEPGRLPGGFVGVDVFFVISGFVVTASLAGHSEERLGAFLARFYARRLVRLVPALVTMLLAATVLYVLFVPPTWFNRAATSTGQAAFWGLSNWVLDRQVVNYFEPRAEFNPFTHTWSLGVEEQFYLVAPLLLFVALGRRWPAGPRRLAAWAIALLAGMSLAATVGWAWAHGSRSVFYLLPFRFWELAAGVLLYLATRHPRSPGGGQTSSAWRLARPAGALLLALAMLLPRPESYPWLRAAAAASAAVLLIGPATHAPPGRLAAALASRPAVWIGLRSYALYLWHWPVYVLARWTVGLDRWPFNLVAVLLSVGVAAASYRLIENPLRQSPALRQRPALQQITLMVALLAAGWLTAAALHRHQPALGLGKPTRQAADWYVNHGLLKTTLADQRRCEPVVQRSPLGPASDGLTRFVPAGCTAEDGSRLFVIGDSHATAYLPLLEQLSAEQGRTIDVVQVPGCAYVDLMTPMTPETDARCHAAAQAALRHVLAQGRAGDVVFLPSLRLPRLILLGGQRRAAPNGDVHARTPQEWAATDTAAADAIRWIAPLTAAGLRVVIELPKPLLRAHPFMCVDVFNRGNPLCSDGLVESLSDQQRLRAPVVQALERLQRTSAGVHLWDPLPLLCSDRHCAALHEGRPLFFDADHLSPFGNLVLLPALRAALAGPHGETLPGTR